MSRISSVLLDRDGTVIVDKEYLSDPAGVELLPGASNGMRALHEKGLSLFIVTNQSGIGRGYFSEDQYRACHAALEKILEKSGLSLTDSAFCPHYPEDGCGCRKPALGMWREILSRNFLDPQTTAMVGDKAEDAAFGRNAGFPAVVLVLTGKGKDVAKALNLPVPEEGQSFALVPQANLPGGEKLPHVVARDLEGAASFIMGIG